MEKIVRIGKIEDQDAFRRQDMRRLTPNQRVAMLLEMQCSYWPEWRGRIARVATLRQLQVQAPAHG